MRTSSGPSKFNGYTIYRFFRKVAPPNRDGCMLWTGARTKGWHGIFSVERRPVGAHRFAWSLVFGQIPNGMCVCHKCDNPACCNIEHLFLGTQKDNLMDMRKKGRQARGGRHGNAKLTDAKARTAIAMYMAGKSQRLIGEKFGVAQTVISEVVRGRTWSHATGLPNNSRYRECRA